MSSEGGQEFSGRHVPQPHCPISAAGREESAVGTEGYAVCVIRVTDERAQVAPSGGIP
ncbi:hypothetical protein GCM10022245_20540 [Streptomyces mayteni]